MWNEPNTDELSLIPRLYSTEHTALQDKLIYLHLFLGGCDWYICEIDETFEYCWGFVILNSDYQNAEWGYISLSELKGIRAGFVEVDCNNYFRVRPAIEVDKIRKAHPHWARYERNLPVAMERC